MIQSRLKQLRALLANRFLPGALCLLMVAQPQFSFAASAPKKPKPTTVKQIQGDERILHALNRFTFGPRPGDLEAVKKIGLDRWFEDQLHPGNLDETALNEQLATYPSIQTLSTVQLMERFPNDRMIRDVTAEKMKLPENSIERTIYNVQIERYKERRKGDFDRNRQATLAAQRDLDALHSKTPAVTQVAASSTYKDIAPPRLDSADTTSMTPELTEEQKKAVELENKAKADKLINSYQALTPKERIHRLLSLPIADLDNLERHISHPQREILYAGMDPEQLEIAYALDEPRKIVPDEMMAQRVVRGIYSNAQLQEVMVDFWLNHFNIFLRKNEEMPYYLATFERDTIRPRSLGKFEDLLNATAHSPAMMLYLDNATSIGPNSIAAIRNQARNKKASEGLNENYARELMELHTVGVNGGYTQADVTNVARILTGWGVDKPLDGGDFIFNERRHEPGSKLVMGRTFNEDGENEGRALIHMLATSPQTANFISRKLAIRFVSDDPPTALVNRMAKTFLSSGGDIAEVLRTLFHSPEFWSAENYRSKVKTPNEFVISAVRASGITPKAPWPVLNAIRDMGMPFYGAVPPTGYTWNSTAWVTSSALVSRMNFALFLTSNRLPGCVKTWSGSTDSWLNQSPVAVVPATEEARLEAELVNGGVSPTTRAAILRQIAPMPAASPSKTAQTQPATIPSPAQPLSQAEIAYYNTAQKIVAEQWEQKDELIAGLLMGSPEFQRR